VLGKCGVNFSVVCHKRFILFFFWFLLILSHYTTIRYSITTIGPVLGRLLKRDVGFIKFVWVLRNEADLDIMKDLLGEVEAASHINMEIFITQQASSAYKVEAPRSLKCIQRGRPQFPVIVSQVASLCMGDDLRHVGALSCGPGSLISAFEASVAREQGRQQNITFKVFSHNYGV
jgi:hypothetical protein